jgi:hypothetical protein
MKGVGEEVFSCLGLDFRASESGDLIALKCGGEVAIKDIQTKLQTAGKVWSASK